MFKAVNELEHFGYQDAVIRGFQIIPAGSADGVEDEGQTFAISLEAVIVRSDNSQNSNYTDSYAGDLTMRLMGANIQKGVKEGYKYYDANDVLLEEVPDTPLSIMEIHQLIKNLDGAYLWAMQAVEPAQNKTGHYLYLMGIDVNADTDEEATYWLQIEFDKSIMEWERYMNRVTQ